jgi:predicted transcriptional regulator of viral defense system
MEATTRQTPLDRSIAEAAAAQHGIVGIEQLRALGLTTSGVSKRVAAGRLHPVHRGVYAVGHPILGAEGRWCAAVMACGPRAALSHRSAAAHLGIRSDARRTTEVTGPTGKGRGRKGIQVHRSRLAEADVTTIDGIPCTTVARTLLDLAEVVRRRELERAVDRAEILRVFDLREVEDVLVRAGGRRGAPVLRSVLAELDVGETLTRNRLEELFLAACAAAGVPRPRVNGWIPLEPIGFEADFLWEEQRLIVETDGRATHGTRRAFEEDRERDRRLLLAGWRVARFTWRDVSRNPEAVGAEIAALLASRT